MAEVKEGWTSQNTRWCFAVLDLCFWGGMVRNEFINNPLDQVSLCHSQT